MADLLERLQESLASRYRIDRELGAGGMAVVFLAEDLRHRRQVALKVLRPELAAEIGPGRFVREIETAARLTHPHILPVHDSGEAGGFLYYVMPYVEGESLHVCFRKGRQRCQASPFSQLESVGRRMRETDRGTLATTAAHRSICSCRPAASLPSPRAACGS